ncbi:MAG: alpha/beta hydrolase [Pirellulales bacterium]|nr:alpha/beta hydrolase [Pirellulales bacterium]
MSFRKLTIISVLVIQYFFGFIQSGLTEEGFLEGNLNLRAPTLGGKQFWADELFFHRWRIQQNVFTGHYRLLDENDLRHAWGTFEECKAGLEQIKTDRRLPPMKGKAVIVLHGICGTRLHMSKIGQYLETNGNYTVVNVAYPTTQREIAEHAKTLAKIIDNLDGIEEVNFVAHSMGNVVIRHYLNDLKAAEASNPGGGPAKQRPKFNRFVMLAPPNHGSGLARYFADNWVYKTVTGDSGRELGRDWSKLESHLASPDFEFGIIAGGKGDGKGYNPLLAGDNDGVIGVETARLAGAKDFVVIPAMHHRVQHHSLALVYTLRFLKVGSFERK